MKADRGAEFNDGAEPEEQKKTSLVMPEKYDLVLEEAEDNTNVIISANSNLKETFDSRKDKELLAAMFEDSRARAKDALVHADTKTAMLTGCVVVVSYSMIDPLDFVGGTRGQVVYSVGPNSVE